MTIEIIDLRKRFQEDPFSQRESARNKNRSRGSILKLDSIPSQIGR